ncbi:MAG: hypothetical protein IIY55_06750 [Blautia sp.]|nr:hypothetical protein [Blautia sp.]
MKKILFSAVLAVFLLAFSSIAGAQTQESSAEENTEGMLQNDAAGVMVQTIEDTLSLTSSAMDEESFSSFVNELGQMIRDVDLEELKENMKLVLAVVSSEEFQSLVQYQEVIDLAALLLKKGAETAVTEKELTEKILQTLGLDERWIRAWTFVADHSEEIRVVLQEFAGTEDGAALLKLLGDKATLENLLDLMQALSTVQLSEKIS